MLLLFPQIEKGVHDYIHRDDFFGRSDAPHLHLSQHHCLLCDFILTITHIPVDTPIDFNIFELYNIKFPEISNGIIQKIEYFISLRAPPARIG
jgi:hypothetical protein